MAGVDSGSDAGGDGAVLSGDCIYLLSGTHSSIDHRNYFQTAKGHMPLIILLCIVVSHIRVSTRLLEVTWLECVWHPISWGYAGPINKQECHFPAMYQESGSHMLTCWQRNKTMTYTRFFCIPGPLYNGKRTSRNFKTISNTCSSGLMQTATNRFLLQSYNKICVY